jgi:putative hydrolase of the HAD superfamily
MEGIEAVMLDVGGVFHLPDHGRILEALQRAGVEADARRLDRAHYVGVAALERWPQSEDGIWRAYQEAYATEVGTPADRLEDVIAELDVAFATPGMWTRVVPGSVESLRRLASSGRALAIVSNADGTLEARLAAEGICQVGPGRGVPVTVVLDSAAVGVAKPDPGIFHLALAALGMPPEAAVHVGDTVGADVDGALAAGIRPLHLDPYDLCEDRSHDHLGSLDELASRFDGR